MEERKSKKVSFVLQFVKGTYVPLPRKPLTNFGLMIEAANLDSRDTALGYHYGKCREAA